MKRTTLLIAAAVIVLVIAVAAYTMVSAASQGEVGKLKAAASKFQDPAAAQAAGYSLVDGLDYCFDKPGTGGMGLHYIQTASLDTSLNPLQPEAMVYHADSAGNLKLGAVEFIVPAEPWDKAGHTTPPTVLGRSLHLNPALGVYVLHVWLFRTNPAGQFEDWNPDITCAGIGGPS